MLYLIGGSHISDQFAQQVITLVVTLFNQFKRVFSGGLFIIHGLTLAIQDRIDPHIETILSYIATALDVSQNVTDDGGMRTSCGLISDFASCAPLPIIKRINDIITVLKRVLLEPQIDTTVKLHAIIAIGDIALCAEGQFNHHLQDIMKAFYDASLSSLAVGETEEEKKLY